MELLDVLFSLRGRLRRGDFWYAALLVVSGFVVTQITFDSLFGPVNTWWLSLLFVWSLITVCVKRYHDIGRSGWWLLLLAIPILGPLWVLYAVGFRKGQQRENRFGSLPGTDELDYLNVEPRSGQALEEIRDVTGLISTRVKSVVRPSSIAELQAAVANSTGPISIGGGRFSMGGQIASPESLHIDMRSLNSIVHFSPKERWIRVEAGARWCDLQRFLDPHDLSVKIMQTYANFTIGGSIGVNSHGRYMGLGPLVLSVRSLLVLLADGTLITASRDENIALFYGVVGGYGGLGIVVEAELDLAENCRVEAYTEKFPIHKYDDHFRSVVKPNVNSIFHNADIFPPDYGKVRATTWMKTDKPVTQTNRLMRLRSSFPLERYFYWAVSETPTGKWRRQYFIDPLMFFRRKVHWRNYEAGYDVAELEPGRRDRKTYVLQEYFVPEKRFDEFVPKMVEVFQRHRVNVINVSIRHAIADSGTVLAWARSDVFAFVIYYKQGTDDAERDAVGVWTRELIDAVLSVAGTYYLPYQPHATLEQFLAAYPRAPEFFALKQTYDPKYRFRNSLWNKYYRPEGQ